MRLKVAEVVYVVMRYGTSQQHDLHYVVLKCNS